MIKIKMLVGFATIVAALLASTATAGAWFESNSAKTQGVIKSFPATTTFVSSPKGQPIVCKGEKGEPAGEWDVQVKAENSAGFQEQTKAGPHLQLKFKKWGTCLGPVETPATVKCSLQITQENKNTGKPQSAKGGVYPPGCVVVLSKCEVKVAVESANKGLSEVTLENIGTNEVGIGSKIKGITSTVNKGCEELNVFGGKEGTFETKGSLVAEGLKLI
jgi:hypothetical protein